MAKVRLTKVTRKDQDACFITFEKEGKKFDIAITPQEYDGMGNKPEVLAKIPDGGLYKGGWCRRDFDTPTGMLRDGEYGDDDFGGKHYHFKTEGNPHLSVKVEKIIADEIDLNDPEVKEALDEIKGIVASMK